MSSQRRRQEQKKKSGISAGRCFNAPREILLTRAVHLGLFPNRSSAHPPCLSYRVYGQFLNSHVSYALPFKLLGIGNLLLLSPILQKLDLAQLLNFKLRPSSLYPCLQIYYVTRGIIKLIIKHRLRYLYIYP